MVKVPPTRVAIIGGGAAGLFLAQDFKRSAPHIDVVLFEASDKLGRKIDASGNGRGNLSNVNVASDKYNQPKFVEPALSAFSPSAFLSYAGELGLQSKIDEEGRIYPLGDNGKIFRTILEQAAHHAGVDIRLQTPVTDVSLIEGHWQVNKMPFDYVVFATGSQAGASFKGKVPANEGLIQALGHHWIAPRPTLASIGVREMLKTISGQRVQAKLDLRLSDGHHFTTAGEVLFRTNALSGIAVFECSSYLTWALRKNMNLDATITLDLLANISKHDLEVELQNRLNLQKEGRFADVLLGYFTPEINRYLLQVAGKLTAKAIATVLKELTFTVDLNFVPDNNQVESGGVDTVGVESSTLASKLHKRLYFIGEALDVDGFCGGYNLHFAWASAYLVSQAIQRAISE